MDFSGKIRIPAFHKIIMNPSRLSVKSGRVQYNGSGFARVMPGR